MNVLVAGLRSVVTYVAILVYIIMAAPLALVCGVILRWKAGMFALGHAGVWLALSFAGIRYRVFGRDHIPTDTAVVFCSNHESNVDPPVLFRALHRRLHIFYKAELRRFPIMSTVFDVGGFVPVERANRERVRKNASALMQIQAIRVGSTSGPVSTDQVLSPTSL